jgi:hypothetical protein
MAPYRGGVLLASVQGIVTLALTVLFAVLEIWAFVDCLRRPANAFPAVGRQSKQLWLILTAIAALVGIAAFTGMGSVLGMVGLAGVVIALIYLFDIRPRIVEITGGRR